MKVVSLLLLITYCFHDAYPELITTELVDDVYSFVDNTAGYNSMFIVTTAGVIAIEPVSMKHAAELLVAIRNKTSDPVKYLLTSHNHWDPSSGGKVFKDAGAITLVHAEAYEWMVANKGKETTVPDESWEGETKNLTVGNTTIELHYVKLTHGLGMTVFLLPKEKIIYVADLVVPRRLLFTIVPDFNMAGMENALADILKLEFDRAIFSHNPYGNSTHGGNKTDVADVLQFIQDLRSEITAMIQNTSIGFGQIPKSLRLPKYESWGGYDDWLEMNVWRILFDGIMGPYPWRPTRVPMCTVQVSSQSMCKMESAGVSMCKNNSTDVPTCTVEVTGKSMCKMESTGLPMCKTANGSPLLAVSVKSFIFVLFSSVFIL